MFPWPSRAVKFVRHETFWEYIYISPYDNHNLHEVEIWNKEHPEEEWKVDNQVQWNEKHPKAPIGNNHPFFPVTPDAITTSRQGPRDCVIVKLSRNGSKLLYRCDGPGETRAAETHRHR